MKFSVEINFESRWTAIAVAAVAVSAAGIAASAALSYYVQYLNYIA